LEHPVNSYLFSETLLRLRVEDMEREAAMAALVAQLGSSSRPSYRKQLATGLRAFARFIDPAHASSARQIPSIDLGARAN
jgi:hypothetical protein